MPSVCRLCGGPISGRNKLGICTINPECRAANARAKTSKYNLAHPDRIAAVQAQAKIDRAATRPRCDRCGSFLGARNQTGICTTNPECAAAYQLAVAERENAVKRERVATDPEYRAKVNGYKRTPEAREIRSARRRERWETEPEYRDKQRAKARGWYYRPGNYERARAAANEYRVQRRMTRQGRAAEMRHGAQNRAQQQSLPFTITTEDVLDVWFDECPYHGGPFGPLTGRGRDGTMRRPSLDRIDPAIGYVPGNIVVVCFQCNSRKKDMTVGDLRSLANAIEQVQRKLAQ